AVRPSQFKSLEPASPIRRTSGSQIDRRSFDFRTRGGETRGSIRKATLGSAPRIVGSSRRMMRVAAQASQGTPCVLLETPNVQLSGNAGAQVQKPKRSAKCGRNTSRPTASAPNDASNTAPAATSFATAMCGLCSGTVASDSASRAVFSASATQTTVAAMASSVHSSGLSPSARPNANTSPVATGLVFALGLALGLRPLEWTLLAIAATVVWVAEALNTALEALSDATVPEHSPHIAIAKDVAAGAVLLASLGALAVGLLVFLPHLAARFGFWT